MKSILIDILPFALQLLKELKMVNFTYEGQTYFFDKKGNFVNGYDLIVWTQDGDHRNLHRIGRYHALDERIELDEENVAWLSTVNSTVR